MGKPVGVKLHRRDGTVLNVELVEKGFDEDGIHHWAIANAVYRPGDELSIDEMPPRSSIGFRAIAPLPGTGDITWHEGRRRWWHRFFKQKQHRQDYHL